jgi:hypothetical protein
MNASRLPSGDNEKNAFAGGVVVHDVPFRRKNEGSTDAYIGGPEAVIRRDG